MLYLYNFYDEFYEKDCNEEALLKAINDCKELKTYSDEGCLWISKNEMVVLDGKELKATDKFYTYVDKGWFWDESDYLKIETDYTDGRLEITRAKAMELLSDDLRQQSHTECGYEDRIWNAEEPSEEANKILDECIICVFELLVEDLKSQLDKMEPGKVEWN